MGWRREPAHSRGAAHRRCAVVYPKKGRCLCLAAVVSFVPLAVMVVPALCLVLGPQDASTALLPGSCQLDEERASSCLVWGIGPWGAATKGFMGGSHGEKRVAESQLRLSHNKEQNRRVCPCTWLQTRAGDASGQWHGLDERAATGSWSPPYTLGQETRR